MTKIKTSRKRKEKRTLREKENTEIRMTQQQKQKNTEGLTTILTSIGCYPSTPKKNQEKQKNSLQLIF